MTSAALGCRVYLVRYKERYVVGYNQERNTVMLLRMGRCKGHISGCAKRDKVEG